MICRRLSAADAALHFAVYFGTKLGDRDIQSAGCRSARCRRLGDNVRFVVTDPAAAKGWLADLERCRIRSQHWGNSAKASRLSRK